MDKKQPKTNNNKTSDQVAAQHASVGALGRRNPGLDGVIAVVDFVLAYLFLIRALDTGSLLQYALVVVLIALGVRSAMTVIRAVRHYKKAKHGE